MTDLEQAYNDQDWFTLGNLLFWVFCFEDRNSERYHLADLIFLACSRKERALMEEC